MCAALPLALSRALVWRRARAALALATLVAASSLPARAQEIVPEPESSSRPTVMAIVGIIAGGLGGYAFAQTQNPPAKGLVLVGATAGGVAGWFIGRQLDAMHRAQYHGVRPISPRSTAVELESDPEALTVVDSVVAVGGSEGVNLFISRASLIPVGRRAAGLLAITAVNITPKSAVLALGTGNGLYLFPPVRGRGSLVSEGSVPAAVGTPGRVYFARGERVLVVPVDADSVGSWPGVSVGAPVRALALDAPHAVLWAVTDQQLIALRVAGDSLARIGAAAIQGGARRVAVRQQKAMVAVAVGERGVQLFDTSDPTHPRAIATWTVARFAYDVSFDAERMFVAAGPEGVYVVEFRGERWVTLGLARSLGFASAITSLGGYTYLLDRRTNSLRRFASFF